MGEHVVPRQRPRPWLFMEHCQYIMEVTQQFTSDNSRLELFFFVYSSQILNFKEDDEEFEIEYNDNMLQNKPDRLQILVSDDMFLNVYFSNSDGKLKCWLLIFVSNTCEMFFFLLDRKQAIQSLQ